MMDVIVAVGFCILALALCIGAAAAALNASLAVAVVVGAILFVSAWYEGT